MRSAAAGDEASARWPADLARACAGDGLRAVYQPLADLHRGVVVGYEALVRFDTRPGVGPDAWFAAARRHGCEVELEAAALRATLAARPDLPPDTFLTVNVGPDTLASGPVASVLDRQGDLRGLVVEVTEQTPIDDYGELAGHLDVHRDRGALVAIDDAGAGYAGLAHILQLRPSILKLDRSLVCGIDADEAKRALVEMLGIFAGRIDAWILAEGIETTAELEAIRHLAVPLGQGWVLGRPAEPWAAIAWEPAPGPTPAEVRRTGTVQAVMEQAAWVGVADPDAVGAAMAAEVGHDYVVVVDDRRVPVAAITRTSRHPGSTAPVLRLSVSTPVADAARRALTRPSHRRFEPLVCTDGAGRLMGIVRMERVLEFLAGTEAAGDGDPGSR